LMPFKSPDTTINPNQAPPSTKKAYWTHADEKDLVGVLLDHKSESGNGSNFKATMFRVAIIMLEKTCTRGGPKDVKSCKNKWQQVCMSPYISTNLTHQYSKLCSYTDWKVFYMIWEIKSQSGWSWSNKDGAGITLEMKSSWNAYVLKKPLVKPFQNQG
jgi:hypothetical protein